jgi:uridine kinase
MDNLREVLEQHTNQYPLMQPCDAVKLIYQNEFGAKHLTEDKAACEAAIHRETAALAASGEPHVRGAMAEAIGNGIVRLNLAKAMSAGVSPEHIHKMLMTSAQRICGSEASFKAKLAVLEAMASENRFSFTSASLREYLEEYRNQGCPPVHHSPEYRAAYAPAYRVIDGCYLRLLPVIVEIERLLGLKERVVLGIDGQAASGKTTAAELLTAVFDANLIHMDDFFLPLALRTPKRMDECGGNIHYERFKEEVIGGLGKKVEFSYRVYDCSRSEYSTNRTVSPRRLCIIEGAYCLHREIRRIYDLKIFFSIHAEEQRRRILKRNGEKQYKNFEERWIPMENHYIVKEHIQDLCSIHIE